MTFEAAADRYDDRPGCYRYTGRSGLKLPALSLGLWQNFGDDRPEETQRAILRRAFDRGVTHFDLANNYGPPYGRAEENFGRYLADDFAPVPRRAGHLDQGRATTCGPGPYGQGGGSRKYVLASLDQSLARMGLDYVDIFYSHRFDPETPRRGDDDGARHARAVRARRCTPASRRTPPRRPPRRPTIARELGTPLLIHQPSYSMLNRWIERGPAR